MDHFITDNPVERPAQFDVPYLCVDSDARIETLDELYAYPTIAGFDRQGVVSLSHTSTREAAAFFQEWMYFGLLNVVLRLQDIQLVKESFYRINANTELVTSSQLPHLLDEWTKRERERNDRGDARASRFGIVKKALSYARHILSSMDLQHLEDPLSRVVISVQALAFSIVHPLKGRFSSAFIGFGPQFGPAYVFLEQLQESGWCRHDITVLAQNLYIDAQYYCTAMTPPRRNVSHAGCSDRNCTAMDIDEDTYETKHTSSDCTCSHLAVPLDRLHGLVNQFKIPLVQYHPPSESSPLGSVEVVEKIPGAANVSFSHVWADGLGNTSGQNALPRCQLDRLQRIANMTYGSEAGSTDVPFYIDTLCVPRDREYRKRAIRKMRDVYKTAGRVLVLDSDIESLTMDMGLTAACITIYFSGWMRRLWTYQEGALNTSLYFKLRDEVLSFESLKTMARQVIYSQDAIWNRDPMAWSVAQYPLGYIIKTFTVLDLDSVPRALTLAAISDAFHSRSTSRVEDESVVMAAMIDKDPEEILEASGPERMKIVLRALRRVPAALAVFSGDRMDEDGYRWAPRSLLGVQGHDNPDTIRRWYSTMLRINQRPGAADSLSRDFANEVHVGDVTGTGALRLREPGLAVLSQAKDQVVPISSPFWAAEFSHMHPDHALPVMQGFLRVRFLRDVSGVPGPLPCKVFFVVAVEEPNPSIDNAIAAMSAFVCVPDEEISSYVERKMLEGDFDLDSVSCRFYCRAVVEFVSDLSIVTARWSQEIIGEDGTLRAHLSRRVKEIEWLVS